MDDKVQGFDVSSATVELAAAALNYKPERYQALAFKADEKYTDCCGRGCTDRYQNIR